MDEYAAYCHCDSKNKPESNSHRSFFRHMFQQMIPYPVWIMRAVLCRCGAHLDIRWMRRLLHTITTESIQICPPVSCGCGSPVSTASAANNKARLSLFHCSRIASGTDGRLQNASYANISAPKEAGADVSCILSMVSASKTR